MTARPSLIQEQQAMLSLGVSAAPAGIAEDALLAGLTAEQREAVTTRISPLCLIAGAGSGKTRVLTRRIAWQVRQGHYDRRRVLAVTFSRRAARELRSRLRGLGLHDSVKAGTFHAVALAQLRRRAEEANSQAPRILESHVGLIAKLNSRQGGAAVAEIADEIGWAKARLVAPDEYAQAAQQHRRRMPRTSAKRIASAYSAYEDAKRRRGVLDFDDVLTAAHDLMLNDTRHAKAHRWAHRHILVDEFQDINPLQFALLRSWIDDDSTLLAVGDPEQAIYGWNGADPGLIADIGSHFNGCAVLHLRTNFRSTPQILAAAGRVMGRTAQPSVRPRGDDPEVSVCDDDNEAATLALAVRRHHQPGTNWRRQAVLARTNAQLAPLRDALQRHDIPVVARGDRQLTQHPHVATLLARWPPQARLGVCVSEAREELNVAAIPASSQADALVGSYAGSGGGHEIEMFLDLTDDHLALHPAATVGSFLAALGDSGAPVAAGDGVSLLTFHAAKGLEWPIVHLVGVEDGYVPIARARTAAARDEERRLFHVAITRAEQKLHVLWCRSRGVGGELVERSPSPWLDAVIDASRPSDHQPVDYRAAIAQARQALRSQHRQPDAFTRGSVQGDRA